MVIGGDIIMSKARKENIQKFKEESSVLDERRSEEEVQATLNNYEDYFITSGYMFDDLMIFRLEVYSFDLEHLHLPSVRCTIEPRGRPGLKLTIACDKIRLTFARSCEEDGEHFITVHGVCNVDLPKEIIKLIEDYDNKETTIPPK